MSLFTLSQILGEGSTLFHNVAWNCLIYALLLSSTYFLWSRWNLRTQSPTDAVISDAVESRGRISQDKNNNTLGNEGTPLEDVNRGTLHTTTSQENKLKLRYDEVRMPPADVPRPPLSPESYTVGWICAITIEYVTAQLCLDVEHERPEYVPPHDNNDYTLGRIGQHNVVIAVLPDGEYGISSAASVAKDLLHTFPNIRIGLMVGIGGGAPSASHDVRLGDIVVSTPRAGEGGVLQYDFGKAIQDQGFQLTGFLNRPPTVLLAAVNGLKAEYQKKRHQLENLIGRLLLQQEEELREELSRPDASSDRLYRSSFVHPPGKDNDCAAACGTGSLNLIHRPERRRPQSPVVHYGLVASANQLMKDALLRDRLIEEKDVLCFEMEAAGLMNHFPCLVIRGICDYSDSHKNKEWQGYAAMVAAAYAKDLLYRIAPNKVEAESKISDVLSDLQRVVEENRDIAKEGLQIQKDRHKERLLDKEKECHQMFRLTTGSRDTTYEWYKDRVEERVEGTCMWLLEHEHFLSWLNQGSGPLLVSADPGCGKSVLAKYLIDYRLPPSASICYFFFKDQDQNTVRQALCALIHQLLSHTPSLVKHAMMQLEKDGQGLIHSTESLWKVLRSAIKDPQAGSVIIVLDALDECAESELGDLMRNVESQFHGDLQDHGKLKYLLTCRPYNQILSKFRGLLDAFPKIHIPGEDESETISQEVNRVIAHRIKQLSKTLSPQVKNHLEQQLQKTTHRTYLWVYLVFDYLERENFKKTPKGVESAVATLPRSVNEAYEQILNKSKGDPMVRKALSIILAASRPLTLAEMNIAINIDSTSMSVQDLDLEDDEDFKTRLRSWCGLFVSIYRGSIYFLHQTAREFLLAESTSPISVQLEPSWYHSIHINHAHAILAEACVLYLNLFNFNLELSDENEAAGDSVNRTAFLNYSAETWGAHFRDADIIENSAIIPFALGICNPDAKSYSIWFDIFWETTYLRSTTRFTDLMVASYFGHQAIVKLLLDKGVDFESKDGVYHRTPLAWASKNGHEAIVKLLLDKGADVESKDKSSRTPLFWAAESGHNVISKLLLDKSANFEFKDRAGYTPLLLASEKGHEAIVGLLLGRGANSEIRDNDFSRTPLSWASEKGHEAVVKLLLDKGAYIESYDRNFNQTPLSWAAEKGHEAIVRLLVDKNAYLESKDESGRTPLLWASGKGHKAVIKILVSKGANIECKDDSSRTPVSWASEKGYETIIKLFLDEGVDLESKDTDYGQTPLLWAIQSGHEGIAKLLLDKGANIEAKDDSNRSSLSWASENGNETLVRLLLERGARIESKDTRYEQNPLSWACKNGHEGIIKLLLDKDTDLKSMNEPNQTPLSWATRNGHTAIVRLLLDKGADFNSNDDSGRTPLSCASKNGHEAIIKLLLDKNADLESKDSRYKQTPLSWASRNGHEKIVNLLLNKGADFNSKDKSGRTSLLWGCRNGHKAIVQLLLDKGADFDLKDKSGRTPLSWTLENGHEDITKLLLDKGAEPESKDE